MTFWLVCHAEVAFPDAFRFKGAAPEIINSRCAVRPGVNPEGALLRCAYSRGNNLAYVRKQVQSALREALGLPWAFCHPRTQADPLFESARLAALISARHLLANRVSRAVALVAFCSSCPLAVCDRRCMRAFETQWRQP